MSEKSEVHVIKKKNYEESRILEQIKWRSKDQNSKEIQKVEDTRNQTTKVVNSKKSKIKCQKSEEFQKSSIVVS